MLKQLVYRVLADTHRKRGLRRLRLLEGRLQSQEARFAVPFAYRGSGYFKKIEPRQNPQEIETLYKTVCRLAPKTVLEIGTARGGTLYLWTQAAAEDATIVSVDLPGGKFGGAYPDCRIPFYRAFARESQHVHLLRRDSHERATYDEVHRLFGARPVDFAFIDGDHTYQGVKADFQLYGPLVRPGGLIAFHDILPRPGDTEIEVDRFWREIRGVYNSTELIGPDGSGRRIGIGLITIGSEGVT